MSCPEYTKYKYNGELQDGWSVVNNCLNGYGYMNSSPSRSASEVMIQTLAEMKPADVQVYLDALREGVDAQRQENELNRQRKIQARKYNFANEKFNINVIRKLFESYVELIDVKPEELGAEFDMHPTSVDASQSQSLKNKEDGKCDYCITLNMSTAGQFTIDFKIPLLRSFTENSINAELHKIMTASIANVSNMRVKPTPVETLVNDAVDRKQYEWRSSNSVDSCVKNLELIANYLKVKTALGKLFALVQQEDLKIAAELHQAELVFNIAKQKATTAFAELADKQRNKFMNMLTIFKEGGDDAEV